ncbi:hypothetical protein G6F22_022084 [Rhizopus arrhizus]|nr:hypothetical protein G6F22_022084 [Rhizopus arrhizus]
MLLGSNVAGQRPALPESRDVRHEKAGACPGFFVVGWRAVEQLAGEGWLAGLRCWRATERCASSGRADRGAAASGSM